MWNLATSNKLCSDRLVAQQHQRHLNNIASIRPSINNAAPEIPEFLRSRQKQEKMKEVRAATIQYENKVLLDKMMDIERKQSQLNPVQIKKKSFIPTKSLHTAKRVNELKKINTENRALLRRLQSAQSIYNVNKWVEDDRKNVQLKRNISQNARRTQHVDYGTLTQFPKFNRSGYSGFYNEY